MRKLVIPVALVLALMTPTAPVRAANAGTHASQAAQLASSWSCEITQANGARYLEHDMVNSIGKWVHGTARSFDGSARPFYDYYLGYVNSQWTYIQIDPADGSYFIGTSAAAPNALDGSHWNIVYPAGGGQYTVHSSAQQFSIRYADLTQVCNKTSEEVTPPPAPTMQCKTWRTGQSDPLNSYLSVAALGPNWWQGVAMDSPAGGNVIYEYNIFSVDAQRISIEINAGTGAYAVATSHSLPTLDSTVWTVVYPTVENGFTFKDVSPKTGPPQSFTVIFADGHQTCTASSSARG